MSVWTLQVMTNVLFLSQKNNDYRNSRTFKHFFKNYLKIKTL